MVEFTDYPGQQIQKQAEYERTEINQSGNRLYHSFNWWRRISLNPDKIKANQLSQWAGSLFIRMINKQNFSTSIY